VIGFDRGYRLKKTVLLMFAPVILLIILYYPLRGAIVDDTFIHLQYARNLVRLHELSFNPHEPTYGATSPLWVLILTLTFILNLDPVVACRVFSISIAAASVVLLGRFVYLITRDRLTAVVSALILAGEAWFVRWSSVGMETSLAVLMMIIVMHTVLSAGRSKVHSLVNAFVMFLAVLARPELILVFVIYTLSEIVVTKKLEWRGAVFFILLYAGWILLMRFHTGTYFPLTAGAKHGGVSFDFSLVKRAVLPIKIMSATLLLPLITAIISLAAGVLRGSPLFFFLSGDFTRENSDRLSVFYLFSVAMIVALPTSYVLLNFQLISRYLVPIVPLLIVTGVVGLRNVLGKYATKRGARRVILIAFTVLVLAQSIFFYTEVVVPPTVAFSEGLKDVLVRMGVWLKENTPGSTVVALPDIGAVGYYSERRVLDLGGLVSPEINRLRRNIDYEEILDKGLYLRFHPDYLIDRSMLPERFKDRVIEGRRFIPVLEGEISALGIRKKGPFTYVLYRIEQ